MINKQKENNLLELIAVRDNIQDNTYTIENDIEDAIGYIDNAMSELSMVSDSIGELNELIEKFKEELTNE